MDEDCCLPLWPFEADVARARGLPVKVHFWDARPQTVRWVYFVSLGVSAHPKDPDCALRFGKAIDWVLNTEGAIPAIEAIYEACPFFPEEQISAYLAAIGALS